VRRGEGTEIAARSLGTNDRVFRTDSLVDMAFLLALKVAIMHFEPGLRNNRPVHIRTGPRSRRRRSGQEQIIAGGHW
jgi:hypothetical protein